MPSGEEFDAVNKRVLTEFAAQGFGTNAIPFDEAMKLREYAKERTDLQSNSLSMEQDIWKSLYEGLTEELRKNAPDTMAEIEVLEKRQNELASLQSLMGAKLKAHPHDYGIRTWWGFVIVGLLVGWMRSVDVGSVLACGLAFWIAGLFFSIFAIDSAEVQSKIGTVLRRLGEKRVSEWLYRRALRIR